MDGGGGGGEPIVGAIKYANGGALQPPSKAILKKHP